MKTAQWYPLGKHRLGIFETYGGFGEFGEYPEFRKNVDKRGIAYRSGNDYDMLYGAGLIYQYLPKKMKF